MDVRVVEYSAQWPIWFAEIAAPLKDALNGVGCHIEHVGSTSVNGLAAKPIIDIDIIVDDFADFPAVKRALQVMGYYHRGDLGIEGREVFATATPIHPHHLYVCKSGLLALKNHLMFRDYLRNHPGCAQAYALLKQTLAKQFPTDIEGYCAGKSDFIATVLSRCELGIDEVRSIKAANLSNNSNKV